MAKRGKGLLENWKMRQEAEGYDVSNVNTLEEAEHFFDNNPPKKTAKTTNAPEDNTSGDNTSTNAPGDNTSGDNTSGDNTSTNAPGDNTSGDNTSGDNTSTNAPEDETNEDGSSKKVDE